MTTNLVKLALVLHVFIAVAVMFMVCGRHDIGPTKTVAWRRSHCWRQSVQHSHTAYDTRMCSISSPELEGIKAFQFSEPSGSKTAVLGKKKQNRNWKPIPHTSDDHHLAPLWQIFCDLGASKFIILELIYWRAIFVSCITDCKIVNSSKVNCYWLLIKIFRQRR